MVQVACAAFSVTLPQPVITLPPFLKATVLPGVPLPLAAATVAVSVTDWPTTEGLGVLASAVVVSMARFVSETVVEACPAVTITVKFPAA